MGFGIRDGKFYVIKAKATVVSTGGAAGLYRSATNDGTTSHHQMWMNPFNVGTGYAMGIRAGGGVHAHGTAVVRGQSEGFLRAGGHYLGRL